MRKANTVKMKDVVERAGVSAMTVSLALGHSPRISPETRRRVLEVVKELQYSPNARGRALRSGFTNIIGLYAGFGAVNVRLPFFTEVVSGLQEGCEQVRKDLLLHGVFHGGEEGDFLRNWRTAELTASSSTCRRTIPSQLAWPNPVSSLSPLPIPC